VPKKIAQDDLLADIRRVANEIDGDVTVTDYKKQGIHSVSAMYTHFDGWEAALEAAGVDRTSPTKQYTKNQLLDDLRRVAEELDSFPPTTTEYKTHGNASVTTMRDRFDGWNNAVETAGMEPKSPGKTTTKRIQILADIKRVMRIVDGEPSTADYKEHGEYAYSTVYLRFEDWDTAVAKAKKAEVDKW
jgi:hypothetical protein